MISIYKTIEDDMVVLDKIKRMLGISHSPKKEEMDFWRKKPGLIWMIYGHL